MNLQPLFETQRKLDQVIEDTKGLHGQDLINEKILALQVELGELANELPEVFKFWSNKKNDYEKALKEYVDGLHFILSIGNDIGFNVEPIRNVVEGNIIDTFSVLFEGISSLKSSIENIFLHETGYIVASLNLQYLLNTFINLGKQLGFTWSEIETAYYSKNKINLERQANGY